MSLPPGPRAPRLLQTRKMLGDQVDWFDSCRARYGDIFTIRPLILPPLVIISDPAAIKAVFTGDATVLHAGKGNRILEPVVGPHSILLLDEGAHMRQRKLMLPAFHGERMQAYGDAMAEITRAELDGWRSGEPISLHPAMQRITLRVILRTVFGLAEGDRMERLIELMPRALELGERVTIIPPLRRYRGPFSPWNRFVAIRDQVDAVLYDEIRERRGTGDLAERTDVLSMLLGASDENGEPMSDGELRDELLTMIVAGHETTATSMSWAFERLVRHPESMSRLVEETDTGEDAYLEAVIKETMRVRPVLHFAMRRLTAPFELMGYELPAGVQIGTCVHLVHQRPDLYPDPAAFKPERFLGSGPDTYSWIPFGGGVRRCIGASFALYEMRVVMRTMLETMSFEATRAADESRRRRAITLIPGDGALVTPRARTRARAPLAVAAA